MSQSCSVETSLCVLTPGKLKIILETSGILVETSILFLHSDPTHTSVTIVGSIPAGATEFKFTDSDKNVAFTAIKTGGHGKFRVKT